jgi:hypothetical protein
MARYDPELLTREEYLGTRVQYGRQAYGKYDPFEGWSGVDVETPPVDAPVEGEDGDSQDTRPDAFALASNAGEPLYDIGYGVPLSGGAAQYKSYDDYKAANKKVDTNTTSKDVFAGVLGLMGGLPGKVMGSILKGETVTNAFGFNSLRPSGPLGWVADKVHEQQYSDMQAIQAAINLGQAQTGFAMKIGMGGITRAPGAATYTGNLKGMTQEQIMALDALNHGFVPRGYDVAKETGITIQEAGWLPASLKTYRDSQGQGVHVGGYYTANGNYYDVATNTTSAYGTMESAYDFAKTHGLTYDQAQLALSQTSAFGSTKTLKDIIDEVKGAGIVDTYDPETGAGTPSTGAGAGVEQTGITEDAATGAPISGPAFGPGTPGYTEGDEESSTPDTPSTPVEDPFVGDENSWGDNNNNNNTDNDSNSDNAADDEAGDTGIGGGGGYDGGWDDPDEGFRKGGKVPGYAFGTPPAGVQASQSGFIDAPPSQVTDGAKVADDRPMKAKEGTYIINAAAVEYAGEKDIRKMIMDAQKEAVRRGLSTEDFERHSNLIDIAVSSGEVTIAPHLVKIIGEDRLEKINKRGIRKTEQRIAQNGQQPVQAARGGFLA